MNKKKINNNILKWNILKNNRENQFQNNQKKVHKTQVFYFYFSIKQDKNF